MSEQALVEIRARFGGVPNVFAQMHEVGDLAANWALLRELYTPGPVPALVIEALLTALALRCDHDYCFVMHTVAIASSGVDKIELEALARVLAVPSTVPEHPRWSRIVRLAWLAAGRGDHRHAAAHALARTCSPEEHQQILHACTSAALLARYVTRFELKAEDEPGLAMLPPELRELIPDFIAFHVALSHRESEAKRPVSVMCSSCGQLKSNSDQQWYPRESALALLPKDVMFSHALCEVCLAQFDFDA